MSGKKFDGGKAPLAQGCLWYFPKALNAVAAVSAYGANKYDVPFEDKSWQRVERAYDRYSDALARHFTAEGTSSWDDESQLLHAAHAAWNALARLELMLEEHVPLSASGLGEKGSGDVGC